LPDYLKAAKNAKSPKSRRKFARLHREQRVRHSILNCESCSLFSSCTAPVPWNGPTLARLVIVGEGPGRHEDEQGEPFVGPSGKVLNRALAECDVDRSDVMVLNAVCCRPPDNRTPTAEEIEACRPNLEGQLKLAQPFVGVLLGKSAYEAVIGPVGRFGDVEGGAVWREGRIWVPAYHPAYLLRNRKLQYTLRDAIKKALGIQEGKVGWPPLPPEHFDFAEDPSGTLDKRLSTQGYAQLYSAKLEDVILITRDETIRIPQIYQHLPNYTMEELVRIGLGGAMKNRMRVRDLRSLHLVKRELGGKVVT